MIDNFYAWLNEHYDVGTVREPAGTYSSYRRCRRCGVDVWHLTKHAVNVHGDTIEIMPSVHQGKESDHEGRLIGSSV